MTPQEIDALVRRLDDNMCDGCSRGAMPRHDVCDLYYNTAASLRSLLAEKDAALNENYNIGEALTRQNEKTAKLEKERDAARELLGKLRNIPYSRDDMTLAIDALLKERGK